MKQITIDYTVSPASVSDEILGHQGESLATELAVKLPAEMINDGSIAEFCGAFGSRIGIFHSKRIKKSEITDGVLSVPITAEISSKPSVSFQVEAFSSDDSLIMKTSLIEGLTFDKSVCRNHSDLSSSVDPAELANITAEIKANTLARHTHANIETLNKLGDSNGNLTYDGKLVGGSDKIKIKRREFDMSNVGEDYVDGFAFIDIFATNTISFFVKENLPNNARIVDFDIEFNGNIYSSSELAINDLISYFDNIQIHPSLHYDAGMAAYLAVTIACNDPTVLLYSNIGNEYNLTKLFLYYIDSEVEIIPYE